MNNIDKKRELSYLLLFIGFIFELSFKIDGFDILVDFIGYIIVFVGLIIRKSKNEHLFKSSLVAFLLILLTFMNFINVRLNLVPYLISDRLAVSLNLILFVNLNIFLYYFLIKDYINSFSKQGLHNISRNWNKIFKHLIISRLLYMGLSILWVYTSLFVESTFLAESLTPTMLLISFYTLITQIVFLYYLFKSYKLLSN